ncbi:MAG: nucleotidyltransferase family protein [Parcubacteria group bacterium]|nr:nucleotidyltransferase family protein [Parcubacteria group bacterium]
MNTHIEEIKRKILPILKAAGVTRSSLFGSVARGEASATSDVDILVELPRDKSLLDFVDLKLQLEDTLHTKVDLVEYDTVKPLLKPYILNDQITIL